MSQTFVFYDLETSGLSARSDRIMQFAAIRTDLDMNAIGEPWNLLVKLNDDTLPSPEAVMVTGITPQSTLMDGVSEAEFARLLADEVCADDTIMVGFNNVRFDDEFLRFLFWRTFHDPYEWCWSNGRSRWDMLDVIRMTRALRPDGIEWPMDDEGRPTNRLELLTKANGISHEGAHDALSDVQALIDVTKLLKSAQPKLFDYLFKMRDKKAIQELVNLDSKRPFVYTSGRYDNEFDKTTVAFPLTSAPHGNVLVYDLRYDPTDFVDLNEAELEKRLSASWQERKADDFIAVPVKQLQYNRCPAVAPVGVLNDEGGWERIGLSLETIEANKSTLLKHPDFAERLRSYFERKTFTPSDVNEESKLYDGFIDGPDKIRIETVRNADGRELADFHPEFSDERLAPLLLRYKARNYPSSLSEDEAREWEQWRAARLNAQLPSFLKSLQSLAATTDPSKHFLLEELQLWAESVLPVDADF